MRYSLRSIMLMLAVPVGAIWASSCGDGSTEPPPPPPPEPDPPQPATVVVSPDETRLIALGATAQLSSEVRDLNGQVVAGATVSWASGDAAVATVNESGLVTAEGNGTVTITATAGSASGNATVTVAQELDSVLVSPLTATVQAGDTLRIWAGAFDANGHAVPEATFSWSSSDSAVATVDTARLVTAVGPGRAVIAATADGETGSMELLVLPPIDSIFISPATDTIAAGDTLRLVAEAFDANGRPVAGATFAWSSSDVSVVRVDRSGLVRGVGDGTADVSAAFGTARGVSNITVAHPDRVALEAFYRATDGENWANNHGWMTDAPLYLWHGVATDTDGRVIELSMHLNDVTGPIPPELADLSRLEELSLVNSKVRSPGLTGPIPVELARLSRLRRLDFNSNSLTGPIPPALANLLRLEELTLSYNLLTGSIPGELGEIETLWALNLHGNRLSGAIPPELGNLSRLAYLWLFRNDLSGPIPGTLGNLSNLRGLGLSQNALTGPIPAEIGRLFNLERLWLHENQLESIPPEFGRLVKLQAVWLWDNKLTGPIPAELGALSSVTDFFVHNNDLSGPLPPGLGRLRSVERLWLSGNRLEGGVPEEFGGIGSLRELDLTNNAGMSGTLPHSLTALELRAFLAGGTDLCAPRDADFQAWLDGVFKRRVKPCQAEGASAAYLAQAMQSREYPVPLVAGEEALLRVFVTAPAAGGAGIPPVRATFYLGGAEAHVAEIAAQSTPIPSAVDEGNLDASANARVPGDIVQPGLEMVIEIDPDGTLDPGVQVRRRIPEEGRAAVDVRAMPTLALTLVPFLWTQNPDSAVVDMMMGIAADPENHELLRHTRTLLPVGGLDVRAHDPVLSSTNSGYDLHARIRAMRVMEGGSGHYMGLMSGRTTGAANAETPGWTSFSWPQSSTIAHELGHNMSLFHAPGCRAPSADPAFPNPDATIGVWGYEFHDEIELVPPSTHDLMSYCRPRWIGEYHFANALRYRLSDEGRAAGDMAAASGMAATSGTILLWGGIDERGRPFLEPAFLLDSPPAMPGFGSEYEIVGKTADGDELFSFRFDMPNDADSDGRASFAFALPAEPGWAGRLASVTLSGPGGSATLDGETDRPMAILLDRRTGQVRGFLQDPPAALAATAAAVQPGLDVMFSRGIPER